MLCRRCRGQGQSSTCANTVAQRSGNPRLKHCEADITSHRVAGFCQGSHRGTVFSPALLCLPKTPPNALPSKKTKYPQRRLEGKTPSAGKETVMRRYPRKPPWATAPGPARAGIPVSMRGALMSRITPIPPCLGGGALRVPLVAGVRGVERGWCGHPRSTLRPRLRSCHREPRPCRPVQCFLPPSLHSLVRPGTCGTLGGTSPRRDGQWLSSLPRAPPPRQDKLTVTWRSHTEKRALLPDAPDAPAKPVQFLRVPWRGVSGNSRRLWRSRRG